MVSISVWENNAGLPICIASESFLDRTRLQCFDYILQRTDLARGLFGQRLRKSIFLVIRQ